MEKFIPGKIYLADQRGMVDNDQFTSWSTFNHADYFDAERKSFGPLLTMNDEVFMPGHKANYQSAQNIWVVIIPVTGKVVHKIPSGNFLVIDAGEVYVKYIPAGNSFELKNPYDEDSINFLYLEFKANGLQENRGIAQLYEFDFENRENELIRVNTPDNSCINNLPFVLHIGRFNGREEALYQLHHPDALFFAFVIAGAFELQGRLLHPRDSLALWDLQEADMEALSNGAVVLVLEMKA